MEEIMAKIGLFYGSNDGHTEYAAEQIKQAFDVYQRDLVEVYNIARVSAEDIGRWDKLIFGIPTWNIGELQDDWDFFMPQFESINFTGKTVAVFGLGDQYGYSTTFLDAVGVLAEKAMVQGADLVGLWPAEGYQVEASLALEGPWFLGLALDDDNQSELTEERINQWVRQLIEEFELTELAEGVQ
jgi:flavodoxin I